MYWWKSCCIYTVRGMFQLNKVCKWLLCANDVYTHDGLPSLRGEEVLTKVPDGFTDSLHTIYLKCKCKIKQVTMYYLNRFLLPEECSAAMAP
ncbi:hypothetical protein XELAEV_18021438mg [Xenopus laevis]|uniref:Uncharacterized protein n=1 Tax=Xenopus laevis TaxID=8355 RepID=A0A974HRK3_XENLA|nr:hypothetical protein XELAEV_18021438mg [Xenopus laevis]